MSIKVTVNSVPKTRVSINNQQRGIVRTIGIAPSQTLSNLSDVDASDSDNNETLVYDSTTGKYVIKVLPLVDGGDF
jgi:hypothetical protein